LQVAGAKVGDVVLVTPTNRVAGSNEGNFVTYEGIIASAGNIKINAVNHDDVETIAQATMDGMTFDITILSFS